MAIVLIKKKKISKASLEDSLGGLGSKPPSPENWCDMREVGCTRRASDARDQVTCKH